MVVTVCVLQLQMALKDWEESRETALRCISNNDKCVEALALEITYILARTGNYQEVCTVARPTGFV